MPYAPKFRCCTPGCSGEPVRRGYCADCAGAYDQREGSHKRLYDKAWRGLRAKYFKMHPQCENCKAAHRYVEAVEVHHKHPVREFPELRLVWRNLCSLCKPCHTQATQEETRRRSMGYWQTLRESDAWRDLLPKIPSPPIPSGGTPQEDIQ